MVLLGPQGCQQGLDLRLGHLVEAGMGPARVLVLANNSELPNSSEWDGEGLPPVGVECEYFHEPRGLWVKFVPLLITDIESSPNKIPAIYGEWYHPNDCMWEPDLIDLSDKPRFRKPESPEQKAERERLEAAYDLYLKVQERDEGPGFAASFNQFQDGMMSTCRKDYLSIVDITGYRKGSK